MLPELHTASGTARQVDLCPGRIRKAGEAQLSPSKEINGGEFLAAGSARARATTVCEVPGVESTVRRWWRRLCSILSYGSDSVPGRGRRKLFLPLAKAPRTYASASGSQSPWFPDLQRASEPLPGRGQHQGGALP